MHVKIVPASTNLLRMCFEDTTIFLKINITKNKYICIKLMAIRELSASQAGKILGITKQTANTTKLRGIKKLRKVYEERNK